MVILAVIVWIVLLLICSRGVYLYATSNVEKIVAELNETKQIYWAGKIEKCFKKFRLGIVERLLVLCKKKRIF